MNYLQRQKKAFMAIVNSIKGFVRSISGIPPITLEDCVDDNSVINYQIYGNSIQNGEPSPDNPIKVESVGEKTKNLFDESLLLTNTKVIKVEEGYKVSAYPATWGSTSNLVKHLKSVLKPGVTYTLSRKYIRASNTNNSSGTIAFRNSSGAVVNCAYNLSSITFSLTQEEIDSITMVYIYGHTTVDVIFSRIQLVEGETTTEYEPYGYKIPVTARGKNLLNEDLFLDESNWIFNDAGDSGRFNFSQIGLEEGKRYTLLYNLIGTPFTGSTGISVYNSSGYVNSFKKDNISVAFSFIATDSRLQLYVPGTNGAKNNYHTISERYQIMIVEESYTLDTIGDYEPYVEPITTNIYLDEPLRKVGDYADCIDSNGKLIRNIFESNITKPATVTSGILYGKFTNVARFSYRVDSPKQKLYNSMLSCLFKYQAGFTMNKETIFHHSSTNANYYISLLWTRLGLNYDGTNVYRADDETQTPLTNIEIAEIGTTYVDSFPDEYKKIYMVLNEPTETPIDLQNLPTFKGTTVYEINTITQPSNMAVEYYSTTKGE